MRNPLLSLTVRWVACFAAILVAAQSRDLGGDDFAQLSPPQADKALSGFRASRLLGDLYLRIEITHKPRQGESSAPLKGLLWAASTDAGQQMRGEIHDGQGRLTLSFVSSKTTESTRVWISTLGRPAILGTSEQAWQPIAEGMLLSPFDLHLPFTHWANTRYLSTERSRGRPVHFFEATNPQPHAPAKVTFGLDRTYGALVQAVCRNAKGEAVRTLQVDEFSQVDDQWILGGCSVRDEITRDADIVRVTEAAVGLRLTPDLFRPETLSLPAAAPGNLKKL